MFGWHRTEGYRAVNYRGTVLEAASLAELRKMIAWFAKKGWIPATEKPYVLFRSPDYKYPQELLDYGASLGFEPVPLSEIGTEAAQVELRKQQSNRRNLISDVKYYLWKMGDFKGHINTDAYCKALIKAAVDVIEAQEVTASSYFEKLIKLHPGKTYAEITA